MGVSFKLGVVSDAHLGYASTRKTDSTGVNLRVTDGYRVFESIITEMIQAEVDAVLVPGDTFHVPEPKVRDIVFAQDQFRRLARAGIKVYILAGNHDSLDLAHEVAASRVLHDPDRHIYSHVEPYVHYELTDGLNVHMVSHHLYHEQAATMQQVKPLPGELNIFSTHGSVIDPIMKMKLTTELSPREVVIPDFLLTDRDWSYTLLGHIHERGWVGSVDGVTDSYGKKIFYGGSIIRRGFSDKEVRLGRGWTEWHIATDGTFTPIFHTSEQRRQFDFYPIDAEQLSAKEITDSIIENLKQSQLDGIGADFDEATAPLLRQKVVGITPAKHASLDWKAIDQHASHAMLWNLKTTTVDDFMRELAEDTASDKQAVESGDMVKLYDDWAAGSSALANVQEELQEPVKRSARKFVKQGQEAVLADD